MKNKTIKEILKATILCVMVAFLVVIVISFLSIKVGKKFFLMATDLIDIVTIKPNDNKNEVLPFLQSYGYEDEEDKKMFLSNCPDYGEHYATLKISTANIDLPIYYGKTLDLLKKGIGHDNDSHFPGEGGSIILMGHNFNKFLGKLPSAKVGDSIQIITNYGDFNYTIYDTKIVEETRTDELPIQEKEEILMIYTCWPIHNIGYTTQRYVVYAK